MVGKLIDIKAICSELVVAARFLTFIQVDVSPVQEAVWMTVWCFLIAEVVLVHILLHRTSQHGLWIT